MKSQAGLIGVLLAAGRGRRMGTTKQLLPWKTAHGEMALVAAAFDAIAAFCETMIVVVGHDAPLVTDALGDRHCVAVTTSDEVEMFASVKAGLHAAMNHAQSHTVLLHPSDHPRVAVETVRTLLAMHQQRPDAAIMPVFEKRGGHPVLIPKSLIQPILDYEKHGGLRQFWIDHPESCVRMPTEDASVVFDIDTPEDYAAS